MNRRLLYYTCYILVFISCGERNNHDKVNEKEVPSGVNEKEIPSTYADDRAFLKKYIPVIELQNGPSGMLIVPQYQARVMTSTCKGDSGYSFGWINYDLIKSKKLREHINPFGGEERLWLAPREGSSLSFLKKMFLMILITGLPQRNSIQTHFKSAVKQVPLYFLKRT